MDRHGERECKPCGGKIESLLGIDGEQEKGGVTCLDHPYLRRDYHGNGGLGGAIKCNDIDDVAWLNRRGHS